MDPAGVSLLEVAARGDGVRGVAHLVAHLSDRSSKIYRGI